MPESFGSKYQFQISPNVFPAELEKHASLLKGERGREGGRERDQLAFLNKNRYEK